MKKDEAVLNPGFQFTPEPWTVDAACQDADPELFHADVTGATSLSRIKQAKAICAACPVKADCLDYAYRIKDTEAVLGGTSPGERKYANRIRRVA